MYKNLQQYLSLLESRGQLTRVRVPVDTDQEIAEIADRMAKSDGPALLFENTGTSFPVAINMFGSDDRMAAALGVDSLDDIPARIEELVGQLMSPKSGLSDKLATLPLLGRASKWFPKLKRGRGECQQVVLTGDQARLSLLPILKCWPHDGGRFVTLPLVNTVDPDTGIRNVGMYRMQVMDDYSTGMHWHTHKTGARHYEAYRRAGRRMPVSVCLGGDPAYTYSAVAPLPDGIDEYLLAGFLRGKPARLVKCVTNNLRVPTDCDIVIEGYVDPSEEKVVEGPFGDHTGFYSLEDLYPLFHVTAITFRRGAVYPATIVGIPPQEDLYIARATEKIFLAPIRLVMQPEITDLYMPAEGVAHNLAIVNIHSSYAGQAAKVASSLWGAGQMMFDKYLIVTSTDRDIRDPETIAALLRGTDMTRAVIRGEGVLDVLDHATATPGVGGKLALDLTDSVPAAIIPAASVPPVAVGVPTAADNDDATDDDDDTAQDLAATTGSGYLWRKSKAKFRRIGGIASWDTSLAERWGILILRAEAVRFPDVEKFTRVNKIRNARIIVLMDETTENLTPGDILWLATANSDPRRDATMMGTTLIVDGRTKLPVSADNPSRFPNVVTSSEATIRLVDVRWAEYGIGAPVESPSLRYLGLVQSDKAEI